MSEISNEKRISRNEKDIANIYKRIIEIEKSNRDLYKDSQHLEALLLDLKLVVADLDATLINIRLAPAKEFENYKSMVWSTVIGIAVAYLIGKYL